MVGEDLRGPRRLARCPAVAAARHKTQRAEDTDEPEAARQKSFLLRKTTKLTLTGSRMASS